jgi:SAM-dependent methyltransferase
VTKAPPSTLVGRYTEQDLELFDIEERARFTGVEIAWELLYRKEPELYERLIAGERIDERVLGSLPDATTVVEVAAGTGRLTAYLSERYQRVIAVEPARSLRSFLERKGLANVDVCSGFFDAIALPDDSAELVVSCSAFTSDPAHGGPDGLREMERVASEVVAIVWPADVDWLIANGFTYESFDGDMDVDFGSLDEAVELARIFYPDAVDEIVARGSPRVPYAVLGMNAPRDWAYKRTS